MCVSNTQCVPDAFQYFRCLSL